MTAVQSFVVTGCGVVVLAGIIALFAYPNVLIAVFFGLLAVAFALLWVGLRMRA